MNHINLTHSICHEQVMVAENEIEGRYHMYRRINAVNQLGQNGLVIRHPPTQDEQCTRVRDLRQIITLKDQEINHLKEARALPLVAKCFEFYRNNQDAINQFAQQNTNINRAYWNTLNIIRELRNDVLHGRITENDLQLLHDSVQYFRRYQTPNTRNYTSAVRRLANVLGNTPPNFFAAPDEYDLANLL